MTVRSNLFGDQRVTQYVRSFVAAALAYATVELLLMEILRRAAAGDDFIRTNRVFVAISFAVYALIAVLVGLLAAVWLRALRRSDIPARELATLALLAAASINIALHFRPALVPVAAMAAFLIVVTAIAMRSSSSRDRLRVLTSAWTCGALLIVPDWVANDVFIDASIRVRVAAFAIASLFTLLLSVVVAFLILDRSRRVARIAAACSVIATGCTALLLPDVQPRELPVARARRVRLAPNVLLITLDTVRADHLSAYGYARPTSPVLQEFAEGATLYRAATAPSNFTLPTHASLFTGLYPSEHRAHFEKGWPTGKPLDSRIRTAAEILREAGYDTSAVAANYLYLRKEFGLDRGFSYHFVRLPPRTYIGSILRDHLLGYAVRKLLWKALPFWKDEPEYIRGSEITEHAIQRIAHATSVQRPFFLFLNYFDAHDPYLPPPPYDTLFPGHDDSVQRYAAKQLHARWQTTGRTQMTARQRDHLVSQYDGAIAYVDQQLARLLRELRKRNLYDDTLIVITSDHGEAFGEHNSIGHPCSLFNDQVHVPLFVKLPRQRSGEVVREPVSLVDVFPLMINGGKEPLAVRDPVTEALPLTGSSAAATSSRSGRAIVRGDYKLIRNSDGSVRLFNVANDPAEAKDIAAAEPARVAELGRELDRWVSEHPRRYAISEANALGREAVANLRSIGYLQ